MKSRLSVLGLTALTACGAPEAPHDTGALLRLDEFVRLGSLDEAGSALSAVADIAVADSIILVLEVDPPRIAVFGTNGAWHRDLGGPGDGPGELRHPTLTGLVGDDVWVGCPLGGRLEVLTRIGASVQSHRWDIDPDSGGVRAFPTAILSDGSILAGPGSLSLDEVRVGRVRHQTYYRVTPGGGEPTVIYRRVIVPKQVFLTPVASGGAMVGMHPLQESPLVEVYPDGSGLVVVERAEAARPDEASWRLQVIRPDGTVETDTQVPYNPVPTTGWLDRRLAEVERGMLRRDGAVNRALLDAYRTSWAGRSYYPPVTAVVAGRDGSVWVRREDTGEDSVRWQVIDRDGEGIGELLAPTSMTILWASLTQVWAVEKNEFDVPFVVGLHVRVSRRTS